IALCRPTPNGLRDLPGSAGWEHGLAPAEQVARAEATARDGAVGRRLGLPGQLEGPAAEEARLPLAGREVRRRPVLRQIAGRDEVGPSFVRLAPEELRRVRDVARLVEDEQRRGVEVVETGCRAQDASPDLGRVAYVDRPSRAAVTAGRPGLEPADVDEQPSGHSARQGTEATAQGRRPTLGQEDLARREQRDLLDPPDGPLVGRIERQQRVNLVAE